MRTFALVQSFEREHYPKLLNLENRIAEDEKLRNLSKKLVNSKSNDGQQKVEHLIVKR